MNTQPQLQQLSEFSQHSNPDIAEYAQAISNYTLALDAGKLSREEYQSLLGDIDVLKKMANTMDEQRQVVQIYDISRVILSLL